MKPKALVPFVVALAAGGGWLFTQRQSIAEIERETEALGKQVAQAQAAAPDRPAAPSSAPAAKEEPVFDWKKSLETLSGGYSEIESRNFRKGAEAMDVAGITAALDEIAALDLPEETRKLWAKRFLPILAVKDPKLALERFHVAPKSREEKSFPDQFLTMALANWTKADPSGATRWLDTQMAQSDLSNKSISGFSQYQVSYEAAVFGVLVLSDPSTAGKRLMNLSEDEAASVISHQSFSGRGVDTALLAKMARESLSEKRRIELFASQAKGYSEKFEDVSGFLERISASPAERAACVQGAASRHLDIVGRNKTLEVADVDTMREWAAANQPGPVGRITGKAIGDVVDNSPVISFDEAFALVMHYHDQSPDDEIIIGFLESEAGCRCSEDEKRTVLAKIADPVKRAEVERGLK